MKHILAALLLTTVFSSYSQVNNNIHHNVKNNLALEGYDPVTYFDNTPEKGSNNFSSTLDGVQYHFITEKNKQEFDANPIKFQPKYGGWCAYAMGVNGSKVKVDPETFKIVNGELLLFYNFWGNNTLGDWNKNEIELQNQADDNWSKILR